MGVKTVVFDAKNGQKVTFLSTFCPFLRVFEGLFSGGYYPSLTFQNVKYTQKFYFRIVQELPKILLLIRCHLASG